MVPFDEFVVHGWDVARSSGRAYDCGRGLREVVHGSSCSSRAPAGTREGLFGPVVAVPEDAHLLDRVIGMDGCYPGCSPR